MEEREDVDGEGDVDSGGEQMSLISPITTLPAATATAGTNGGVSKRYRLAPAKTFQCRGYGECRMVFSRSEHLARHIRKHTGERPFTCHCSKQFSRLDNLRQHAQTVHADRADANERMLRELGVLHAGMARGVPVAPTSPETATAKTTTMTKKAAPRRTRPAPPPAAASATLTSQPQPQPQPAEPTSSPAPIIKREPTDTVLPSANPIIARQRPGTSTGYEGEIQVDPNRGEEPHTHRNAPSLRIDANHAYERERSSLGSAGGGADRSAGGQSFRGHPYTRRSPPGPGLEHAPSSPSYTHTLNGVGFAFQPRPYSSGSEIFQQSPPNVVPTTPGSRPSSSSVRLPPLSSVVSAAAFRPPRLSLSRPSSGYAGGGPIPGSSSSSGFPLDSLTLRRPSSSTSEWDWIGRVRPGTAPGNFLTTVTAGGEESPFSFHVPDHEQSSVFPLSSGGGNAQRPRTRKRTIGGPDGPAYTEEHERERVGSRGYGGSESRPTSRRLSVMELCNDADADGVGEQRAGSSSGGLPLGVLLRRESERERERERPTTTSGLIARASALVLDERDGEDESNPFAFSVGESPREY